MGFGHPDLQVVFGVTLMAVLGVASIAPALPLMVSELGITPHQVGWLITVFTLPGVVLTPLAGILADRWGRRRILVPSLVVFALAGGACSLAPGFEVLLVLRTLQGVGAASLGALNVTVLGDLFSGRERTRAMGLNASVLSIGTAVYPALGGALATAGWRYPFLLPLAALPVALAVALRLRNPEPSRQSELGSYLRAVARALRQRRVAILLVVTFTVFILLYGAYLTYLPLLMARRFSASSLEIGLLMAAASLTTAVTSSQLDRLARLVSEPRLVPLSFVAYAVSLVGVLWAPSPLWMILPVMVFGFAQGSNIPTVMTLMAAAAPLEQRGAFMAANGAVLRLGQTLGPVAAGAAFAAGGPSAVYLGAAGLAVAALALSAAFVTSSRDANHEV